MEVSPYYSINEIKKEPEDRVFHIFDDCQSGRDIPFSERLSGRSNYRKCLHCAHKEIAAKARKK
jgi:hypothetical protein